MKSIGITGGIGSGKTTVCRVLEVLGYPVFYADAEARKVMNEDPVLREEIVRLLGPEAYHDAEANRPYIARKIFSDPELREKINRLVHPAVYRAYDVWKSEQSSPLVFNESALLFETGSYRRFDATILVTASKETRIGRVMRRDRVTREQVLARMENQWSEEQRLELATIVILNDEQELVIPQVLEVVRALDPSFSIQGE